MSTESPAWFGCGRSTRVEASTIASLGVEHGEDCWMTDEALVPLYEELPKVRPALILSHHNERSAKTSGFK